MVEHLSPNFQKIKDILVDGPQIAVDIVEVTHSYKRFIANVQGTNS